MSKAMDKIHALKPKLITLIMLCGMAGTGCEGTSTAQSNSNVQIELVPFASGLDQPVDIQNAGDSRLFIVEKQGVIKIVDADGDVNQQAFLDISTKVNNSGGEQGLLGLAFHPKYSTNGYFYVNYTKADNSTVIARYSVSSDPDIALETSEYVLMNIPQPYTNHNAGQLAFGPDGYLYIGTGDGGSGGDPENRAQDGNSFLGKMLRIDVNNGTPYGIPPDNPFVNDPNTLDEIWALGLRNPWRYSFDPDNGDLWIADVGQNAWEEINKVSGPNNGGYNFGWRCYEGNHPFNTNDCATDTSLFTFPVHEYSHGDPSNPCSVTGGYAYHGSAPEIHGRYFYTDVCSGEIHTLEETSPGTFNNELVFVSDNESFVSFGVDNNNELYVAGLSSGTIYKIEVALGIKEQHADSIAVYPVPTEHKLTIRMNNRMKIKSLEILDSKGRLAMLKSGNLMESIEIDTSDLEKGVYYIHLITNQKLMILKKIVIM